MPTAPFDSEQLQLQLQERLEQIKQAEEEMKELQKEKERVNRLLAALNDPTQKKEPARKRAPKKSRKPDMDDKLSWFEETKTLLENQKILITSAEVADQLCLKLKLNNSAEITASVRSAVARLKEKQLIGCITDTDGKSMLYGPIEFFLGPDKLKPEFQYLTND